MTTERDPYELLTREECADALRINIAHLSLLTRENKLYHVRIGRRVLYPRASIEAFIRGEYLGGDGNWPGTPPLAGMPTSPESKRGDTRTARRKL